MTHTRRAVRTVLLTCMLANLGACAPYRVLPDAAHAPGARTVFCQGPGSSRAPGNRTTTDCFYVDRADLERFMNGRLRF